MQQEPAVRLLGVPGGVARRTTGAFPALGFHLLALLAEASPQGRPRSVLAAHLWPVSAAAQGRTALRQLVRRINLSLGLTAVEQDGPACLRLSRVELTDLSLMRALLRLGDGASVARAFGLWAGPVLQDTSAEGAFGDWLGRCRADLTRSLLAAGTEEIAGLTRYGACDPGTLDEIARVMLALAPDSAAVRQSVRQAYARIGAAERAAAFGLEAAFRPAARVVAPLARGPAGLPHASLPRLALFCPQGQAGDQGLAAQIVAELASCLTVWRSFAVLAPFSSFAVPTEFGLPSDNTALRADYAVSGEVTRPDPALAPVLSLRMTHLADRTLLWSGRFALEGTEIAAGMGRSAARIAATLAEAVESHSLEILRHARDPSALLHFLNGRGHQVQCDLPHVRRARSSFARALMVDDRFAPAHARIAETLFVEWILCGGNDAELLAAARLRADLAVQLDPAGATGHWVRGAVALYQRRFDRVIEGYAEAESLAPHDADMLLEYADALSHLGNHDEAEQRFSRALDLNPLPPDKLWWVGASIAFHSEDFTAAATRCDRMRDAEIGVGLRAATYAQAGRLPEARRWARRLKQALPGLTAEDLVAISPNQETETYRRAYVEGLRLAAF
jgi:tetratricopeptide (TPR) repeat protein